MHGNPAQICSHLEEFLATCVLGRGCDGFPESSGFQLSKDVLKPRLKIA